MAKESKEQKKKNGFWSTVGNLSKSGARHALKIITRTDAIGEGKNQISKGSIAAAKELREQGKSPYQQALNNKGKKLSYKERKAQGIKEAKATASDRHKTFKSDRKLPLGEKSFNKGRPRSEWVRSAYERRQKDATKKTQSAAAKAHDEFQKKHGRGKYSKRAIAKRKKEELAKQTEGGKYGFTTM